MGRCRDGVVRLVNGSLPNEGLVEICYNGRWGAICEDQWDTLDATVVCHQMGFPGDSESAFAPTYPSLLHPISISNLLCFMPSLPLAFFFSIFPFFHSLEREFLKGKHSHFYFLPFLVDGPSSI